MTGQFAAMGVSGLLLASIYWLYGSTSKRDRRKRSSRQRRVQVISLPHGPAMRANRRTTLSATAQVEVESND